MAALDPTRPSSAERERVASAAADGLELPPGYVAVAVLARGTQGTVLRARRGAEDVVLRIASAPDEGASAELAVLAEVRHPGLARLVDHGRFGAEGRAFLARSWIEGRPLSERADELRAEGAEGLRAIGAIVARLCPALARLHAAGFLHGDLKATNVIVAPGGEPVLTDFGLARRASSDVAAPAAGTLFAIAPETLLGQRVDARADLFALGAMLHRLLLERRASARELYARFPAVSYLEATRTSVEELPGWARDVVARLLATDPEARPRSATEVGRALASRLGLASVAYDEPPLAFGPREGRDAFATAAIDDLRDELATPTDRAPEPRWWTVPAGEDPRPFLDDVRLRLALAGASVRSLDPAVELAGVRDAGELDRWAEARAATLTGSVVFVPLDRGDRWQARAIEALVRAARAPAGARANRAPGSVRATRAPGSEGAPRSASFVVGACDAPSASEIAWRVAVVPAADRAAIEAVLARELEGETAERRAELASALAAASGGVPARVDAALRDACARGLFVRGEERWRVRPGPIALALAHDAPGLDDVEARALVAALVVLGGKGGARAVVELARRAHHFDAADRGIGADGARVLAALVARGLVLREARDDGARLRLAGALPRELVAEDAWRRMHAARAEALRSAGAARVEWLAHAWRAEPSTERLRAVSDEIAALLERGTPELALRLHAEVEALAARAGLALDARFVGGGGLAWIASWNPERALATVEPLERIGTPEALALAERVRAGAATIRHDPNEALARYARAQELDPGDAGEALLARASVLHETARDAEVEALAEEALAGAHGALSERARARLENLSAMSAFRRGDVERARAAFERSLAAARLDGDVAREASACINLATIARRGGDVREALAGFERAARLYEAEGLLPRLAQARMQWSGALRESGELRAAEPLLESALGLRERLGDVSGALVARGMLGLLLADRGHVAAASEELERCGRELRAQGRSVLASMYEARAVETRARFRAPEPIERPALRPSRDGDERARESERAAEADPRILMWLARAAWVSGDFAHATERAVRARDLGARLELRAVRREAEFLVDWLRRSGAWRSSRRVPDLEPDATLAGVAPLVDEDERVLAALVRDLRERAAADEAAALARELESRGRDDRAARLWLALAARSPHAPEAAAHARDALARCAAGLSADETERLRSHLLSMPDPWPADLAERANGSSAEEELDMDAVNLLDLNRRLVQQEALKDLLGAIVEAALSVTGAERGFLVLEEDGELSFDTAMDSRRGDVAAPDLEVSKSIVRQALDGGTVLRLSNAVDDPTLADAPSVSALELRSILCAPFEVEPKLRGVVYLDHRLQQGAFAAKAERLLALLADQAVLAIRQVRRLEEIKRLNRQLEKQMAHKESDLRTARAALRDANLAMPAGGMVGSSPPMRAVHRLIERAAPTKLSVLVTGESGTGKELVARALHALSPRIDGPFVSENCAAFPESLIESELFGYRKGAFTGADSDRAGLFERAEGGTLFLDEIGELPIELQAKLLRVLETGEVRRVGDARVRSVDFRLVAATNRALEVEVAEGRFRADLFYRLDGLRIALPPLAERVEDVPELVDHFLRLEAAKSGQTKRIAPAVLARLCRRAWPGNVRELANEVARLWVLSEGDIDDPELVRTPAARVGGAPGAPGADVLASGELPTLEELEKRAILRALELAKGDKRKAAERLGISRAKVYQRLKDWRLDVGEGTKE